MNFANKPLVFGGLLLSILLTGCATYQGKVSEARRFIQSRQFDLALTQLKPLAEKEDGDQLVYLLDYGTALHIAGKLEESNKVFLIADKLSEAVDYHSASRITGSMLLSEEMVQYKGDTFEKVFINAYLAMNYLELGKLDDALVETRRMNEKYLKLKAEEKKTFELNPFAKYLSALIWEADQKWDDAYIAYSEAYKIDPSISALEVDLLRSAKKARRPDEYKRWKDSFPTAKEDPLGNDKGVGELVVIYQQGWGPRKETSQMDYHFPSLRPLYSLTQFAELEVEQVGKFRSALVYNTEAAAIKTLQDDAGALLARRIAGKVAKKAVSDQLRKNNELVGAISNLVMQVSDRADLRQWSTLPQTIHTIRVPLKAGSYKISLQGLSAAGLPTSDRLESRSVTIKPGKKVFINWRSLN